MAETTLFTIFAVLFGYSTYLEIRAKESKFILVLSFLLVLLLLILAVTSALGMPW